MAAKFKDCEGREWELRILVPHIAKFRKDYNLDIGNSSAKARFSEIMLGEPETLVKILWELCEKQAEKSKVTPEQFGEGFDGPAIEAATMAFAEAVVDFSHPSKKTNEVIKSRLTKMITELDGEKAAAITKSFDTTSNDSVGA